MTDILNWGLPLPSLIAALAFGYLLGSIPFGLLLTRSAGLGDIRAIGSGNIGATNVLRTGNKGLAAATLLLDALKGTLAVIAASTFGPQLAIIAGLGAFLGHLFPVWLGFKGGKGVATFLGVLLGLYWPAFVVFALVWLGFALAFRYSSLAALAASLAAPTFLLSIADQGWARDWFSGVKALLPASSGSLGAMGVVLLVMTAMLWAKHHENIRRLLSGTESRIGSKGGQPAGSA